MSDTPYVITTGDGPSEEVARVVIFAVPNPDHGTVEGAPALIEYSMPAEVNPVIGLEYGERSGENAAAAGVWLLKETMGEDGYRALVAECKKMTPKRSKQTIEHVTNRVAGIALGN